MTPLDYAKLCVMRFPSATSMALKGRGHVPRVRVDRSNPFMRLLPMVKIVDNRYGEGDFGVSWYTAATVEQMYLDDLLAAGIDQNKIQGCIVREEVEHMCIVAPTAWRRAQAFVRLTGHTFDRELATTLAARVRATLQAQRTRQEKRADAALTHAALNGEL